MAGGTISNSLPNLEGQNRIINSTYLTQTFHEQRQIENFIRGNKIIEILSKEAQHFMQQQTKSPENSYNAIVIKLTFDYTDFLNQSSLDLLHFLIEEPVQFRNAVKYCTFALLRDIVKDLSVGENSCKANIDIDQVHILIRFVGLPLQKDLCFQAHLNSYRTGISIVIGILSAITQPEKIVLQSIWYCSTGCERNKIKANSLDVPFCVNCKQPMQEYSKLRRTQNFQLLRIIPAESIESPKTINKLYRALTVRALEHVFECMEPDSNLNSIRELSHSQLEALLRFDSPPVTPSQLIYLNISQANDISKPCDSPLSYNREPFDSQIGSQIDFSVFQHYSASTRNNGSISPLNISRAEVGDCINIDAPLKTIELSDNELQEYNNNFFHEEAFDLCANAAQKTKLSISTATAEEKVIEFKEVDEIYKRINFDLEHHVDKVESPNSNLRKCLTQFVAETTGKDVPAKIISSCPAKTDNYRLLSDIKKHVQNKTEADTFYAPLNKTSNNETTGISVEPSFEQNLSEFSFGCANSFQATTGEENVNNTGWCLSEEEFFKDKQNQTANTAKGFKKNNILMNDDSSIPQSVKQLYDIVKSNYSDFAFIYALSSQLCQERVPMECFLTLKIALLLSLVSIGNNENRPPIPIVAITGDTYMTDYLMTTIGQLGSRFLGPIDETKSLSTANWIEADAIILARGGVFYAGDWTRLKLRKAETICKNIECSSVAVAKTALSVPLETAIWTHWRSFKYGAKDQQTFNKFLKIFGIPIFVSDDNHEPLVDYILDQASVRIFESTIDHLSVNADDMRNFLICVSQNNVDLSPEAAILLKDYFVASRSMRPDCLSTQSYAILKQFAESFAKLSMRKVVLGGDALASIIMCEHFIEHVFEPSDYCPPHFGRFNFVAEVDVYLAQFKEWLDSYIKKSQTKT